MSSLPLVRFCTRRRMCEFVIICVDISSVIGIDSSSRCFSRWMRESAARDALLGQMHARQIFLHRFAGADEGVLFAEAACIMGVVSFLQDL